MRTNGTVPEPRTKTKGQHHRQRENMSLPLLHRSFINTGSCAKASASSLDVTSFATDCATMKKTHKRTEGQNQDVSEDRAIVTKRESTRQPHPNHNSPPKKYRRLHLRRKRHPATTIVKYHKHVFCRQRVATFDKAEGGCCWFCSDSMS